MHGVPLVTYYSTGIIRSRIRIILGNRNRIKKKNRIWICIKFKMQELKKGSKWGHAGPWTLAMEERRLKVELWSVEGL